LSIFSNRFINFLFAERPLIVFPFPEILNKIMFVGQGGPGHCDPDCEFKGALDCPTCNGREGWQNIYLSPEFLSFKIFWSIVGFLYIPGLPVS